jgi:hypothetical protein
MHHCWRRAARSSGGAAPPDPSACLHPPHAASLPQLKSRAAEAARHLARLQEARPDDVAAHPGLFPLLSRVLSEGPGLPAAGAAMAVLARASLAPAGRARVQAGVSLAPVVR